MLAGDRARGVTRPAGEAIFRKLPRTGWAGRKARYVNPCSEVVGNGRLSERRIRYIRYNRANDLHDFRPKSHHTADGIRTQKSLKSASPDAGIGAGQPRPVPLPWHARLLLLSGSLTW